MHLSGNHSAEAAPDCWLGPLCLLCSQVEVEEGIKSTGVDTDQKNLISLMWAVQDALFMWIPLLKNYSYLGDI